MLRLPLVQCINRIWSIYGKIQNHTCLLHADGAAKQLRGGKALSESLPQRGGNEIKRTQTGGV